MGKGARPAKVVSPRAILVPAGGKAGDGVASTDPCAGPVTVTAGHEGPATAYAGDRVIVAPVDGRLSLVGEGFVAQLQPSDASKLTACIRQGWRYSGAVTVARGPNVVSTLVGDRSE